MCVAGKWLACQSMDNKVCVFDVLNRFKFMRKKTFKGHMVGTVAISGFLCLGCFSGLDGWLLGSVW